MARLRHRAVRFDAVALARCDAGVDTCLLAARGAMRTAGGEARFPAANRSDTATPGSLDSTHERAGAPTPESQSRSRQTRATGSLKLRQAATPFRLASIR